MLRFLVPWALLVVLSLSPSEARAQDRGLAAAYVGDSGIEAHPDVLFAESFEVGSLAQIAARFDQVQQQSGMQILSEGGRRCVRITSPTGLLYKELPGDYSQLYVRYYVQYNPGRLYHHSGAYVGGYESPNGWPQGGSGQRFSDRFFTGLETQGGTSRFDFYAYWPEMGCLEVPNNCWGNNFLEGVEPVVGAGRWSSVEVMLKVNEPVWENNGELALWIDGNLVIHLGPGYPRVESNGVGSFSPDPAGQPFPGFRWRERSFALNWVLLQSYVTADDPSAWVMYDDLVVATRYIGPRGEGVDTTAPAPPAGLWVR